MQLVKRFFGLTGIVPLSSIPFKMKFQFLMKFKRCFVIEFLFKFFHEIHSFHFLIALSSCLFPFPFFVVLPSRFSMFRFIVVSVALALFAKATTYSQCFSGGFCIDDTVLLTGTYAAPSDCADGCLNNNPTNKYFDYYFQGNDFGYCWCGSNCGGIAPDPNTNSYAIDDATCSSSEKPSTSPTSSPTAVPSSSPSSLPSFRSSNHPTSSPSSFSLSPIVPTSSSLSGTTFSQCFAGGFCIGDSILLSGNYGNPLDCAKGCLLNSANNHYFDLYLTGADTGHCWCGSNCGGISSDPNTNSFAINGADCLATDLPSTKPSSSPPTVISSIPTLSPTVFSSGNGQVQITGKLLVHSIIPSSSDSSLSSISVNVLKEGITAISENSQYVDIVNTFPHPSTAAYSSSMISPFSLSTFTILSSSATSSNNLRFESTVATAVTSALDSSTYEIDFLCVYLLSSYPSYNENPSLLALLKAASINFAVQSGSFQSMVRQLARQYSSTQLYNLTTTNHELILNTTIVPAPTPNSPSDDTLATTTSSKDATALSQGKVAAIVIGGVIVTGILIGIMYYLISRCCCHNGNKQVERRNPVLQQLGEGGQSQRQTVIAAGEVEAKRDSDDEEDQDVSIIIEVV
jgi:hypothetical protein